MAERDLSLGTGYRPLLIGVIWPSTALVLPWEQAPQIASGNQDAVASEQLQVVCEIAADLPAAERACWYELSQKGTALTAGEARRLAELVAPLLTGSRRDAEVNGAADTDE